MGPAMPDADGTEDKSESDDEKEFDKSPGKKATTLVTKNTVLSWVTGEDIVLEEAETQH